MTVTVLAEVRVEDVDRFLAVFSDEGLRKRVEHGCRGTRVLAPVDEDGVVLVLLEFDSVEAFEGFRSDPTAPPIMRKGGAQGPPTFRVLTQVGAFDG